MAKYICSVCEYVHDEEKTGQKWADLPDDWVCPVCESPKSFFSKADDSGSEPEPHVEKVKKE
ncbi:MAG: rubredoxin, partial [Deltaproteobacteria bacterium]|nr:rubredoxin [Deltaproteobacteria bacterium]